MNTIWITGSKGQLGTELYLQHEALTGLKFLFTDIEELDLTNKNAVLKFTQKEKPAFIVNCAAYTAVDKAEEEPEKAFLINRDIPANLTAAALSVNAILSHMSTDFVFDGTQSRPITENELPNPQSKYAESKYAGEKEVLKSDKNLVIRTSWLYSPYGRNFMKTMLRLGKEKEEIGVVNDQTGTPTSATDMAGAILRIIQKISGSEKNYGGIYHYSNEGFCSWFDFATEIMKLAGLNCRVKPISTQEYPLPANRPAYSVLDKSKIKSVFGLNIPDWKESLSLMLKA